ncbi:uncharacterized protein [Euphorbia lathyris]|uniref:uncharacterized protein isoform X2 n=1 Tax=Euphorbia lathyris TaxID=212925 RepID=UPI0033131DBB
MQQRKFGRPSGTDGSDFSYRMVIDSRYTKVAKGKSRLSGLILTQVVIHLVGLVYVVLSTPKDMLAISSYVIGLVSLLIGELGRKWSKVSFLRVYITASSAPIFFSIYSTIRSNSISEVTWNLNDWESKKFVAIEILLLLLGLLVQIFTTITTTSLIE